MASDEETIAAICAAVTWDERIKLIRRVPESHGQQEHQAIYAAIAECLYRPHLAPQFAYVTWRPQYELTTFSRAYDRAVELTSGFQRVAVDDLVAALRAAPETLLVFRTIIGYTAKEFAVAATEVATTRDLPRVTESRVKSMADGKPAREDVCIACAHAIDELMAGRLWGVAPEGLYSKLDKPDTAEGWASVKRVAETGVPYGTFLHQRHYGGAFRQLLDATSSSRGDPVEDAVATVLDEAEILYVRTGSSNQAEIAARFGLTVKPAPDFVVYQAPETLRALIECKQANDGGTARDKAARFRALRGEAQRLGGIPVVAVLEGLGWERASDALGPVVRDTDGRVFTLATLNQLPDAPPFSELRSH